MSREFAKGLAKAKENDFIGAIDHFSIAISEHKHVEYYAERAVAYLNSGQYELSLFDMNVCVELEPNNSYRYSCRAFLKARMGDTEGAITDYEKAVMLDPEDAIALNNLGLVQEQKGFYDKAKRNFDRSNELVGYDPARRKPLDTEPAIQADQPAIPDQQQVAQPASATRRQVVRDVFTNRKSFREFIRFIFNGFKIKT